MESSTLLPEEAELIRLEAEQADLEEQVASAELALETAKSDTAVFQQRYYQIVGRLYAQLDDLSARIADIHARQNPKDRTVAARAEAAKEQARRSSQEAGLADDEPKPVPKIGPELKRAYRQAVKLMHPDLALSERERLRRTELMALLNLAYENGDIREIDRLVAEFGTDPEAVVGEDIASRIVKAIRRIAQLRRRLSELNAEIDVFQQTDAYELKQTIDAAEADGTDPLGELASELAREIAKREAELRQYKEMARHLRSEQI